MRKRNLALAALVCLFSLFMLAADTDNPFMGTWKLNEAKSKFSANATRNSTVVYEASGDSIKVTVDGKDGKGNPSHNEWTGKFDGKDYPVTGDPTSDTRAYKEAGKNSISMTIKKDGKVTGTGKIVVSADGKTRTVTADLTGADGKKSHTVAVYDKQ